MVGDMFLYIGLGYLGVAIGFSIWYWTFKKQSGGPDEKPSK